MNSINSVVDQILLEEEEWAANPSEIWGLPSSIPTFNKVTGGYEAGREYVIGARTNNGKTVWALQETFSIATHLINSMNAGSDDPGQIVVVNPEMKEDELLHRYASSRSQIPFRKIRSGKALEEERQQWRHRLEFARRFDPFVTIHTGAGITATDLEGELNDIKRRRKIAVVVIDYLQLIRGQGKGKYEQTTDVSQRVKQMTTTFNIPIITLSQCRRPSTHYMKSYVVDEAEERPQLSDLRDSGDIEQSCDVGCILFNPPDVENDKDYQAATLYVDKQRNGPPAEIGLIFHPRLTKFEDAYDSKIAGSGDF